jgi:hypothetical protein
VRQVRNVNHSRETKTRHWDEMKRKRKRKRKRERERERERERKRERESMSVWDWRLGRFVKCSIKS